MRKRFWVCDVPGGPIEIKPFRVLAVEFKVPGAGVLKT